MAARDFVEGVAREVKRIRMAPDAPKDGIRLYWRRHEEEFRVTRMSVVGHDHVCIDLVDPQRGPVPPAIVPTSGLVLDFKFGGAKNIPLPDFVIDPT